MRINKRKCNEFPNMLNCLPNKETNRTREVQGGAGHEGNTERVGEREREGRIEGQTCVQQIRERQRFGGSQFAVAVVVVAGGAVAAAALPQSGLVAHSTMPVIKIEVEALNLTVLNEAAAPRCVDRGGRRLPLSLPCPDVPFDIM